MLARESRSSTSHRRPGRSLPHRGRAGPSSRPRWAPSGFFRRSSSPPGSTILTSSPWPTRAAHYSTFRGPDSDDPRPPLKVFLRYFADPDTHFLIYTRSPEASVRHAVDSWWRTWSAALRPAGAHHRVRDAAARRRPPLARPGDGGRAELAV